MLFVVFCLFTETTKLINTNVNKYQRTINGLEVINYKIPTRVCLRPGSNQLKNTNAHGPKAQCCFILFATNHIQKIVDRLKISASGSKLRYASIWCKDGNAPARARACSGLHPMARVAPDG